MLLALLGQFRAITCLFCPGILVLLPLQVARPLNQFDFGHARQACNEVVGTIFVGGRSLHSCGLLPLSELGKVGASACGRLQLA